MRLIDADALIGSLHNQTFLEGDDRSIVYNVIQKQPTVGGWISVKDHPPEKDEDVIIYGYYVGPSGQTYPTTIISDMEEFRSCECVPIAWMPLPEPPEVKQDD